MSTQLLGVLVTAVLGLLGLLVPVLRAMFDRKFANARRRLELLKLQHEIEALRSQHQKDDDEIAGALPRPYRGLTVAGAVAGLADDNAPGPALGGVPQLSRLNIITAAFICGLALVIVSYPVTAYEMLLQEPEPYLVLGFLIRVLAMPAMSVLWVLMNNRPRRSLVDAMQDGLLPPAIVLLLLNANVREDMPQTVAGLY